MKMNPNDTKVYSIVMTAMMMCVIMVSILLLRVPIPFTHGYINLSDAMIFMAVIILGYKYGAVAAGLGSMLGDFLAGFAMWAPWTLCIKAAMALIFGLILQAAVDHRRGTNREETHRELSDKGFISIEIIGMIVAGIFMCAGYYAAEGIMYGNWVVAALGIPWNIAQFVVGAAMAVVLCTALAKTSLRSRMAYTAPAHKQAGPA